MGQNDTYDLLLGKCWLYRMKAMINYCTNHITMIGIGGAEVITSLLDYRGRALGEWGDDNDDSDMESEDEYDHDDNSPLTYSLLADEMSTVADDESDAGSLDFPWSDTKN